MRTFKTLLVIFALLVLLVPAAQAAVITITTTADAKVDEKAGVVEVKFTVENSGDEGAQDVQVEIPSLNQSLPMGAELRPASSLSVTHEFQFSELGITRTGRSLLPVRIRYRDQNFYPLSTVHTVLIDRSPLPGTALKFHIPDITAPNALEIRREGTAEIRGTARAEQPIRIESAELFLPGEFRSKLREPKVPVELKKDDELKIDLTVDNQSGIAGSRYLAMLILRGVSGEQAFAETFYFTILVKPTFWNRSAILIAAIVGLSVIFYLRTFFRRN